DFSMKNRKRQQETITPQRSKKSKRSCTTSEEEDQEESLLEDSRFKCNYCDKLLKTAISLNSHIHEYHTLEAVINLEGCVIVLRRKEDLMYHCPACSNTVPTKSAIRYHLLQEKNISCLEFAKRSDKDQISEKNFSPVRLPEKWRSFDDAIVHASGDASAPVSVQHRTVIFAEKLSQYPIGISIDGKEFDALVPQETFDSFPSKPTLAVVNKPLQELRQSGRTMDNLATTPLIMEIVKKSGYNHVIGTRIYEELSAKTVKMLNRDWARYPQAGLAASQLLAGAILVSVKDMTSVLLNETEAYGRTKMTDCHAEQLGIRKGAPLENSIPSTKDDDYYPGVHPVTITGKDGHRLEIGSFTCDVLITSCTSLDRVDDTRVSVGGETLVFQINQRDTSHVRIFLDKESIRASKKIMSLPISKITSNMGVDRLRQIRSKFHKTDSYRFLRSHGPLTKSVNFQPFTIFTFANYSSGENGPHAAGVVFYNIGLAVIQLEKNATISKDIINQCVGMCVKNSEFYHTISEIALLFTEDCETIDIIGNKSLDKILRKLADSLSSNISEANQKIAMDLKSLFKPK
ncbi:hypothetical protein BGZ76_005384, partial [Entomortierella beljakovae]